MTGSGTNIEVCSMSFRRQNRESSQLTMVKVDLPSVKVSPDEQSTPNMAQISPALISLTS
jgi:hypothetical protein